MNEFTFLAHTILLYGSSIVALWLGKEALMGFIILQSVLANLFVTKTIMLWGLTVSVSDAFIVGIIVSLQLLQEYYGKDQAKQTILLSFSALIFYAITVCFILIYIPSGSDYAHQHMIRLLSNTPRLSIASLIAYLCSTQFDNLLYNILHRNSPNSHILKRTFIAASCSQAIDTLLFSFIGLYGIIKPLSNIMIFSYIVRLCSIFLSAPFVLIAQQYIPRPKSVI